MPVPQVNVSLLGGFDRDHRKYLEPGHAGQPPENLTQSRSQILQTSSVILSQEGGAALDAELDAGQDPELWDLDEDEADEMADFEEAHDPGGPLVEATM